MTRLFAKRPQTTRVGILLVLAAVLSGCPGGGGGGGTSAPAADLYGIWAVASEVTSNNCGDPNGVLVSLWAVIDHDGTSSTFSADFYDEYEYFIVSCGGTISGTTVSISKCSYYDDGGVTTSNVSGTLDVANMWILGEDIWTWSDGTSSCSGRSDWAAALTSN